MRILVSIPHFCNPNGNGFYGSVGNAADQRAKALASLIACLHQACGTGQGLLDGTRQVIHRANTTTACSLRIVVCTTQDKHVLARLAPVAGLFEHRPTQADPMLLGFECHAVLAEAFGQFDYYCFMEDDLGLTDPFFFAKLAFFTAKFGDDVLLQPNRFEPYPLLPLRKVYIDGNLARPELSQPFQDVSIRPAIEANYLGLPLRFVRVNNPHSGCFFLNANQMRRFMGSTPFPDRRTDFAGPLESAATLGLMRFFHVYKPDRRNAAFLEVEHLHPRYSGLVAQSVRGAATQKNGPAFWPLQN